MQCHIEGRIDHEPLYEVFPYWPLGAGFAFIPAVLVVNAADDNAKRDREQSILRDDVWLFVADHRLGKEKFRGYWQ